MNSRASLAIQQIQSLYDTLSQKNILMMIYPLACLLSGNVIYRQMKVVTSDWLTSQE